jgi:hypothetical protein
VKETIEDSLNRVVADFYDEGIVELVQSLDKSLNDYAEKFIYILCSSEINII